MAAPRLRFAPSPTGALHVGGARTALVNWLEARRQHGVLVLRIEDTDVERSERRHEESILEDLRWLGIEWDEGPDRGGPHGPYRQSERARLYAAAVEELIAVGRAYPCFCDLKTLTEQRREARRRGKTYRYPGTCRDLDAAARRRRREENPAPVVRFRVPYAAVTFADGLRGDVGLAAGEIGDFVLLRSDGTPTYNLVCVVDDHEMAIDHVVRGEDHLPNTPKQLLLYEALGHPLPRFTHLPLVLAPDRTRLSKRHGATAVAELRAAGILPEALCNFLALLGWSPPAGREILDRADLVEHFRVGDLSPTASVFDRTRLEWLNGQQMERLAAGRLLEAALPFLTSRGYRVPAAGPERDWWQQVVDLLKKGRRRLDELADEAVVLWPDPPPAVGDGAELRQVVSDERGRAVLEGFAAASRAGELVDEDGFRDASARVSEATGAAGKALYHPLRVAITGRPVGPELTRLVPLIERGAELDVEPAVPSVAVRIERLLEGLGTAARPDDG